MQAIIFPTNRCNLRCKHCIVSKKIPTDLTLPDIEKIATYPVTKVGILGGEPYMRKDISKIVDLFNVPVTIYTNGLLLTDNNIIPDINYCVSIDGWKDYHEQLRGEETWSKAIQALELLYSHTDDIKSLWIRTTYNNDNWGDIGKLYKKARSLDGVSLLLHPQVGHNLLPLDEDKQLGLFKFASTHSNVIVLQPHFWHFCGYKESTCPAGIYRIAVDEYGNVKPCQWLNEKIGSIHTNTWEEIVQRGKAYHENRASYLEDGCMLCPDKAYCRSSCKMCSDSQTCPLRHQMTASTFYSGGKLKKINIKYASMRKVGLVGC